MEVPALRDVSLAETPSAGHRGERPTRETGHRVCLEPSCFNKRTPRLLGRKRRRCPGPSGSCRLTEQSWTKPGKHKEMETRVMAFSHSQETDWGKSWQWIEAPNTNLFCLLVYHSYLFTKFTSDLLSIRMGQDPNFLNRSQMLPGFSNPKFVNLRSYCRKSLKGECFIKKAFTKGQSIVQN